jgi:ribonuclease BN (tRNA processing enzyme)
MLKIHLIGNGGCVHSGLPHISFVINDKLLVELPPDIMQSLAKNKIHIEKIEKIFISHFHGDHFMGAPFYLINRFYSPQKESYFEFPELFGPNELKQKIDDSIKLAFGKESHLVQKLVKDFKINELKQNDLMQLDEKWELRFFKVDHKPETLGFFIERSGENLPHFAYIPDSSWGDNVKKVLSKKPRVVFCDMNGSGGHISPEDILNEGIKITGEETTYYGVHLNQKFESPHHLIVPSVAGEVIIIQ